MFVSDVFDAWQKVSDASYGMLHHVPQVCQGPFMLLSYRTYKQERWWWSGAYHDPSGWKQTQVMWHFLYSRKRIYVELCFYACRFLELGQLASPARSSMSLLTGSCLYPLFDNHSFIGYWLYYQFQFSISIDFLTWLAWTLVFQTCI